MAKILIAVGGGDSAEGWVEAFETHQPRWDIAIWDPSKPPTGAKYAVVWQPPLELFEHEKELEAIFNLGAGVDALGINRVIPPSMPVYRIEDAGMGVQMAEFALYGILLATQRFLPYEQQQPKKEWRPHGPVLRTEWPVGVMGYGQIGAQVAQAAAQLGYPVAAWARRDRPTKGGVELFAGEDAFHNFLRRSRILINVLPLTDETRGIINANTLGLLQKDGFLINMARGPHVVEADLLAALDDDTLRGALLDVFHDEPLPAESPFWTHPKVHVTPHIAGISLHEECSRQILEKLELLERGQEPSGRVRPDQQY